MALKFANSAVGELAQGISGLDTVLRLATGQGARFPILGADDFMVATLQEGGSWEIVRVTDVSGDLMTVVRAQEGTAAQNFNVGTLFELRVTAGVLNYYQDMVNGAAPVGGIIMYSGPDNGWGPSWALCNGDNGTPDLRDRFIMSTGNRTAAGPGGTSIGAPLQTGQGGEHDHGAKTGGTALTEAQLPPHTHTGTTAEAGEHVHDFTIEGLKSGTGFGAGGNGILGDIDYVTEPGGKHTHAVTVGSTGGGQAHDHTIAPQTSHLHSVPLPPYYALALIQRII